MMDERMSHEKDILQRARAQSNLPLPRIIDEYQDYYEPGDNKTKE